MKTIYEIEGLKELLEEHCLDLENLEKDLKEILELLEAQNENYI